MTNHLDFAKQTCKESAPNPHEIQYAILHALIAITEALQNLSFNTYKWTDASGTEHWHTTLEGQDE